VEKLASKQGRLKTMLKINPYSLIASSRQDLPQKKRAVQRKVTSVVEAAHTQKGSAEKALLTTEFASSSSSSSSSCPQNLSKWECASVSDLGAFCQ